MKSSYITALGTVLLMAVLPARAQSTDPASVVEKWSDESTATRIIDINFTDTSWPASFQGTTGRDCPDYSAGGYVNAIIDVPAATVDGTTGYPVLFHNCTFATKAVNGGLAASTAAFARQYYVGEGATRYNDWTQPGHTEYLEDNIRYNDAGKPVYGEAGFVQMCRDAASTVDGKKVSMHGWMEIDHIPYVDLIQWSWSSTSWGRGIKCDIKIGDADWKPLVWMGSERQKQGWTVYSDQGYFMENVINASDVLLRWRVWDGEDMDNPVQGDGNGGTAFTQAIDPMAQRQAPRVHKIKIYGNAVTAADAAFARENQIGDVGELSDLGDFGFGKDEPAPDEGAATVLYTVAQDGTADYTTIQAAIDAVPDGCRGIIHIAPGVYEENVYAGTKDSHNKFISLIGDDPATTILTSSVSRGNTAGVTYLDCAALNVFVPRFYAEGITIRNTSATGGQAEALYTAGDAHTFRNCVISGYQDTFKANVGARGYFTDCVIEGTVDFIYDGGLEWFDNCEIRSRAGRGYITAPAKSGMPMSRVLHPELSADTFYPGMLFSNCRLTAEAGVADGAYSLGRPWDTNCGSMYLNCTMGSHISAIGWTAWSGNETTSSLCEYRSVKPDGSAVDVSRRASFSRQATEGEVEAYFDGPDYLFAAFSKVPFDYKSILAGASVPANFTTVDGVISWDGDALAAGYLVYRDGVFEAAVTEPSYDTQGVSGNYTVRSVSRHGAVSASADPSRGTRLAAFPTAEGFGKYATGGRGGKVVKVTSLADDGSEGTLRWAFEQHKGSPITIVFEVSGDITLTRELRVNRADWTLAGQTAPGQGIVITHNKVNFGGSQNFIVRNMRFRIGQKDVAGNILTDNACGAENCSNFIFDHCSFGWSVEENMNTADCHFLTVQYSIVHEGLYNAGHSKGARGYGCQWGGSPATYHHNLLVHNQNRTCRFNGARGDDYVVFIEYINNVNYNYGRSGGCYGGENTAAISSYTGLESAHECNFINNYYRPGAASDKSSVVFVNSSYARDGATSWAPAKWYVDGNVAHGLASVTADNWKGMTAEVYKLDQIRVDERIIPANPYHRYTMAGAVGRYRPELYMMYDYESAEDAFNTVVDKAGTVNRDAVETRVANDARTGTTTYGGSTLGRTRGIIDRETDAEGFFAYSADYTVPADTDGDGMPDAWESASGLNPAVADNNLLNPDGYTALEVYLCSLMGETLSTDFSQGVESAVIYTGDITYDGATSTMHVDASLVGADITVYNAAGMMVYSGVVDGMEISLVSLPRGLHLVKVGSSTHAPRIIKVIR